MRKFYGLFIGILLCMVSCMKTDGLLNGYGIGANLANKASPPNISKLLSGYSSRVICDHDGNKHDRDDILAVAMELGMFAKAGKQANLVGFIYNNHTWQTDAAQQTDETNSVLNTAKIWGGYDLTKFISAYNNHAAAVTLIKNEIIKSSATDSLLIAACGPMQIIGEAIQAAIDSGYRSKLQFVRVISHSTWNNQHAGLNTGGASEGLPLPRYNFNTTNSANCPNATFISQMGVQTTLIKDQNATVSAPYTSYSWLNTPSDPKLKQIWDEGQIANKSNFDCSDAGVVWYILKNDQDGSPSKLHDFFIPPVSGTPTLTIQFFDAQSEAETPLDTTIIYLGNYSNSYVYSEGDRISSAVANTSMRNQVFAIAGTNYLSRDYIAQVSSTATTNTVPIRIDRLDYQIYGLRITTKNFPSSMSAYCIGADSSTSTTIPLNGEKIFYVDFNPPKTIPPYYDGISIKFTKP